MVILSSVATARGRRHAAELTTDNDSHGVNVNDATGFQRRRLSHDLPLMIAANVLRHAVPLRDVAATEPRAACVVDIE